VKSVAVFSREAVNSEGAAVEELTASEGLVVFRMGSAAEVERGVVEAKRTPAPFRIKRFVLEN
jgi:hypothetical protein